MSLFDEKGRDKTDGRHHLESSANLLEIKKKSKKCYEKKHCRFILRLVSIAIVTSLAWLCYYYRPLGLCFGTDGQQGKCLEVFKCPFIFNEIKEGKKPPVCETTDKTFKVCCMEDDIPILDARNLRPTYEDDKKKDPDDYKITFKNPPGHKSYRPQIEDWCQPLTNYSRNYGRISFQKCLDYQDKLVYPCQESLTPNVKMERMDNCNWKPDALIIEGSKTSNGEFPHMALLGYDMPDRLAVKWLCDGFIISDRFILTAAHCTYSAHVHGPVTKIRIGFLKKSQKILPDELYKVKKIYKHPHYRSPDVYNDIALLETDRPMALNRFRVPACLHDGRPINNSMVIVTGWGPTDIHQRKHADALQKVTLEKFTDKECGELYTPTLVRHLPRGYDSNTQICYGDRKTSKDSNRGDSGGPAQISHPEVTCMYLVTAVVTNGKTFGVAGSPGMYTRIAPYLDWIESIVWK